MKYKKKPVIFIFVGILFTTIVFSTILESNFSTQDSPKEINQHYYNEPVSSIDDNSIDYLIITPLIYENALEPLRLWKTRKNVIAEIQTIESISNTYLGVDLQAQIKECIRYYYENHQTKWVLLAGDVDVVPQREAFTEDYYPYDGDTVSCDWYYSDLDNNWDLNGDLIWAGEEDEYDFIPEVFVGRLSAVNTTEITMLVNNIINYETDPEIGSWMDRVSFASAILFYDEDYNNDNIADYEKLDPNRFFNYLATFLPETLDTYFLAELEGLDPTDYYADEGNDFQSVEDSINEGNSFGYITGHGNPSGMYRYTFVYDEDGDGLNDYGIDYCDWSYLLHHDVTTLNSGNKLGMYFLGGCSCGTFDEPEDCIQETMLKTCAIGTIAASRVTWAEDYWYERDYGGWYSEGLSFRFTQKLLEFGRPGQAFSLAKQQYIQDRIDMNLPALYPEWDKKVLFQYNLLGDPEVPIWIGQPQQLAYNLTVNTTHTKLNSYNLNTQIAIPEVLITLVDSAGNVVWYDYTNADGVLDIPYGKDTFSEYQITACLDGNVPALNPINITIIDDEPPTPQTPWEWFLWFLLQWFKRIFGDPLPLWIFILFPGMLKFL